MRPLHLIVASVTGASFGINAVKYAVPALLALGGSTASEIGVFAGAVSAAWPVFGLFAGLLLDRWSKLTVLRLGEVIAVASLLFLVSLYMTGVLALALLCIVGFAIGAAEVLVDTSSQSILPEVVAKPELRAANSLLNGAKTAGVTLLAPVLVAVLVDIEPLLALAAAAFVLVVAFLSILRLTGQRAASAPLRLSDIAGGLLFLARTPVFPGLTLVLAVMSLAWGGWFVLIVSYVISAQGLGLNATAYGTVVTILGFGSLTGAFAYDVLQKTFGTRLMLLIDVVGTILFHAVPAAGLGFIPTAAAAYVAGIGGVTWLISVSAYQQAAVPAAMLGRLVASYRWIGWSAFFTGTVIAGPLADRLGFTGAFSAFALLNVAMLALFPFVIPKSRILDAPLAS